MAARRAADYVGVLSKRTLNERTVMSAQRHQRPGNSGHRSQGPGSPGQDQLSQKSARMGERRHESDSDWAESQGENAAGPANRIGSPRGDAQGSNRSNSMPASNDQGGSRWNQQQDPEHPERSADGGQAEMRGNAGSNEQQSGDPDSPDQPESGDRGRRPARRRSES
jgi:hypothetical protein